MITVERCWLGVRADGTMLGNGSMGIYAVNAVGNDLRNNVVGGNGFAGVFFFGASNSNLVVNSKIGTDPTGTVAYSNLKRSGLRRYVHRPSDQ